MKMMYLGEAAKAIGMSTSALRRRCELGLVEGAHKEDAPNASGYAWRIPENVVATIKPQGRGKRAEGYGQK